MIEIARKLCAFALLIGCCVPTSLLPFSYSFCLTKKNQKLKKVRSPAQKAKLLRKHYSFVLVIEKCIHKC